MGRERSIISAAVPLLLAFSASLPLRSETLKGTLLGTITDSTQAVVPGVQLSLTETNTNFRTPDIPLSKLVRFGHLG